VRPLAIKASGMVTPIGFSSAASCAAFRCGISGATETAFFSRAGEPLLGCPVPFEEPLRGFEKLVTMASGALKECLQEAAPPKSARVPIALCVSEPERPGRPEDLAAQVMAGLRAVLEFPLDKDSTTIARGRIGLAHALRWAENLVYGEDVAGCAVVAVDSLLTGPALDEFEEQDRLLTPENSDGFIPGEGAAALFLTRPQKTPAPQLVCLGLGFGREEAPVGSGKPFRGDGISAACRAALADAKCGYDDVQYRLADASGEQYGLKEAQLAIARTLRGKMKPEFPILHPADCIGETGAAIGPCLLGVALAASRKNYAPGNGAIAHLCADDGERAAILLKYREFRA
jgi:3-oxoacyl-[acyl-carrier-protein] synthase-1